MPAKVIIVDDDPIAGGLSRDLLTEGGFDAELITESLLALDRVKKDHPQLVILDILMPGVDGLTLCHQITTDPALKDIRVIVLSGKSFEADKDRARKFGASLFIEKPYSVDTFVQQIQEVLSRPADEAPAGKATELESLSAASGPLTLKIWGCRGGGAALSGPSRYGRRTSCVSLDTGEHLLVFDAGTGLIDLGKELEAKPRPELWLFMTHFHADHTEGLPGFAPAARRGQKLHIGGPRDPDATLERHVADAFQSAPATISGVEADIELYEMQEDAYDVIPGIKVSSFHANHPGATLGFVVETKSRKVVYCPDSELYGETATALQDYDEKLGRLCAGADLLIHDARYTAEDYRTLRNHGHSAFTSVVDFAARHAIKRLVLFHHDSQYDDALLDRIGAQAAQMAADKAYSVQVAMAREGVSLKI